MAEVVQLWVYLSTTPLFGLTATLVVYLLAHALYTRWQQAPWANPVFWSVVTLAAREAELESIAQAYMTDPAFAECRDDEHRWDVTVGDGLDKL